MCRTMKRFRSALSALGRCQLHAADAYACSAGPQLRVSGWAQQQPCLYATAAAGPPHSGTGDATAAAISSSTGTSTSRDTPSVQQRVGPTTVSMTTPDLFTLASQHQQLAQSLASSLKQQQQQQGKEEGQEHDQQSSTRQRRHRRQAGVRAPLFYTLRPGTLQQEDMPLAPHLSQQQQQQQTVAGAPPMQSQPTTADMQAAHLLQAQQSAATAQANEGRFDSRMQSRHMAEAEQQQQQQQQQDLHQVVHVAAPALPESTAEADVGRSRHLEQLLDDMFDGELQQRLQAAVTATTEQQELQQGPPIEASGSGGSSSVFDRHSSSRSSSSSGMTPTATSSSHTAMPPGQLPSRGWPGMYGRGGAPQDAWAPLPSVQQARSGLAQRVEASLQAIGVEVSAQAGSSAAWPPTGPQLMRLRSQQLQQLLEDADAPNYGSKQLLVVRLLQLLQEPTAGIATSSSSSSSSRQSSMTHTEAVAVEQEALLRVARSAAAHPRMREVVEAACARQQLLQMAVRPDQVAQWLLAARAEDVTLLDLRGARGGGIQYVVLATGANQQHAYACVDAVRWQLQQQLSAVAAREAGAAGPAGDTSGPAPQPASAASSAPVAAGQERGSRESSSSSGDLDEPVTMPLMPLTGSKEAEWSVLQAGRLELHVLTGRARQYYNLEQLWAGAGARVTRFVAAEQPVMTKDTIM